MDAIFHERQEGSLCAQHCLNSLLQGPYFSAVDLADIGRDLDEAERATMAEGDINSPEYLRFLQQPSSNMDDSGYFSVQVIGRALKVWSLELLPFGSTEAVQANISPEREKAFICNFKDHWLTIRKLGRQWFNLNSLLTGPQLISDMHLGMILMQLQKEGYSIFVVRGMLPDNEADQLLNLIPAVQTEKPRLLTDLDQQDPGNPASASASASTSGQGAGPSRKGVISLADLQGALQSSQRPQPLGTEGAGSRPLGGALLQSSEQEGESVDVLELRRKRQAFFDRRDTPEAPGPPVHAALSSASPADPTNPGAALRPSPELSSGPSPAQAQTQAQAKAQTEAGWPSSHRSADIAGSATTAAAGHQQRREESYANDEQMTEEAMLEIAIRMSLGGQH